MDKSFWDYVYLLRASEFLYHTKDSTSISAEKANQIFQSFYFKADQSGHFSTNIINGEVAPLSDNPVNNLRYMFVCVLYGICIRCEQEGCDTTMSYLIRDYYMQKTDTITTPNDFNDLTEKAIRDFHDFYEQTKRPAYSRRIEKCIQYVDQNIFRAMRLSDLAEQLNVSAKHLSSEFRKETGIALGTYIKRRRLKMLYSFVVETNRPLAEIASSMNYSSLAHMSREFKKEYGVSPKQMRVGAPQQ